MKAEKIIAISIFVVPFVLPFLLVIWEERQKLFQKVEVGSWWVTSKWRLGILMNCVPITLSLIRDFLLMKDDDENIIEEWNDQDNNFDQRA